MARKFVCIWCLLFCFYNVFSVSDEGYKKPLLMKKIETVSSLQGDSIMHLVAGQAAKYQTVVSKYEADVYIKGHSEVKRRNFLMQYVRRIFPVSRSSGTVFFEILSHVKFSYPNDYLHDFKATNGSAIPNGAKEREVLELLNLNVYSSTMYNDGIILPVAHNAYNYYNFNLDTVLYTLGSKLFKISFSPKLWSHKLVVGSLYVWDKVWNISRIDVSGSLSFGDFSLAMSFGKDYRNFLLPSNADLSIRYHFLGNEITSTYHSFFKYSYVQWLNENPNAGRRRKLNLTAYYKLSADTIPIIRDSSFWNNVRDIPLTDKERSMYKNNEQKAEKDTSHVQTYLELTERLTNTINLDSKSSRLRYSGVLNPSQFGYSVRDGVSYRQRIRYSRTLARDRQLRFYPSIGYVSKHHELFFEFATDWEYLPQHMGIMSLSIGNSNQGYPSGITDKINRQLKDSVINFDDLNLSYFKHYYAELENSIELFNGFQISAGLSYHRRIPVSRITNVKVGDEIQQIINNNYNDFTPVLGFTYTPRQYYWMDGYRKEYLYSYYPTISFEVARGIPHIWKSTGDYCRMEADIQQNVYLALSRHFNYHLSFGFFTNTRSTYFADFKYFARHGFPESWNDDFGGVFNVLPRAWYNASDKYVQGHMLYESPFLLSKIFRPKASQYMLMEHFYLSQLWLPVLPSYTEIGYGFGNNIINVALFAGFEKLKYKNIGLKFVFEIFQ